MINDSTDGSQAATRNLTFSLLVVLLVGGAIRFVPVLGSGFPLNDGGLFAQMSRDLAAHGMTLPTFTTYNGEQIPFAYPPLGLYLAAILGSLPGLSVVAVLQFAPATIATTSIFVVHLLACRLGGSAWFGVAAAGAFALMPRSYIWLVGGGGMTRALGLLLALLAIHQGIGLVQSGARRQLILTALFGGLTALAHPHAAVFLAVSLGSIALLRSGRAVLPALGRLVTAALGAVVILAPWILAVLLNHGAGPFLSAGGTGINMSAGLIALLGINFIDAPVVDVFTAAGVLGSVVMAARGKWVVPCWLLATVVTDPRAGMTYATVPLAIAAAFFIKDGLGRLVQVSDLATALNSTPIPRLLSKQPALVTVLAVILFVGVRANARTAADPGVPLHGLTEDHVAAMAWVKDNTAPDQRFAIVTAHRWELDYFSEWFPFLAQRESVATVQGSEWTGLDGFINRLARFRQLQECAPRVASCLEGWRLGWDVLDAYVIIPKGRLYGPMTSVDCCPALREDLHRMQNWSVAYDGPGATVFAPRN